MIREGLTFDDVLLVPQHSTVESRSKVDLTVEYDELNFSHPIVPANMKTVTGLELAVEASHEGGLSILHRFMPLEEQLNIAEDMVDEYGAGNKFAVSVGVKSDDRENVVRFEDVGVKIVCVDIAHGDSKHCEKMVQWIKQNTRMHVIAGNVATGESARRLWEAGADIVKVGVGPGSLCTTRIETGNGVPQLSAIMDVAKAQRSLMELEKTRYHYSNQKDRKFPFIADGGIKNAGDIVKALCFADMVMVGNLFAGCVESPGNVINIEGRPHKEYVGSSTYKTNHVEGVAAIVPCKGTFSSILHKLLEGLRSGCSYQGAHNLADLRDNPEFIRITNAGLRESHPHDVILR